MQNVTSQYPSTSEHPAEAKIIGRVSINNMQNASLCYSFLSTGDSYKGLAARYRMGESKIHEVINETCDALWVTLQPEVMRPPRRRDWMRIEEGFRHRWHFPNCVGAVDGKHISITNRPESGSLFFNYKGFFSTNLLALVDSNYRFIYVDVGEYGSNTDGNVFKFSRFGSRFMDYKLDVPGVKRLPNFPQEGPLPHVIVADEAFPLLHNLMRPYPGKSEGTLSREEAVFNYRLSRARMVVENAFGILAQRWRIFSRKIPLSTKNVDKVVKAACVLHNYLCQDRDIDINQVNLQLNPRREQYFPEDAVACLYMPRLHGYRSSADAQGVRDIFRGYFNSPQGALAWQYNRISYREE